MTTDQFVDLTAAVALGAYLSPLIGFGVHAVLILCFIAIAIVLAPFLALAQAAETRREHRKAELLRRYQITGSQEDYWRLYPELRPKLVRPPKLWVSERTFNVLVWALPLILLFAACIVGRHY
jgi:hypothetical protein